MTRIAIGLQQILYFRLWTLGTILFDWLMLEIACIQSIDLGWHMRDRAGFGMRARILKELVWKRWEMIGKQWDWYRFQRTLVMDSTSDLICHCRHARVVIDIV